MELSLKRVEKLNNPDDYTRKICVRDEWLNLNGRSSPGKTLLGDKVIADGVVGWIYRTGDEHTNYYSDKVENPWLYLNA